MLTIAELAKDLNVSVQAIYKKINKSMKSELRSHVKTINGQKVIDEQGIELIKNSFKPILNGLKHGLNAEQIKGLNISNNERFKPVLNGLKHGLNSEQIKELNISNNERFKPVLNQFKPIQSEENNDLVNILQDTLNLLKEQLNEKDLQIKEKDNQIQNLQNELAVEHNHSRDISNKLAELTRNSQILLKNEQEKSTLLLSDEQSATVSSESSEQKSKKKKSFWERWRKK